jgi:hypothetical protein
MNSIIDLSAKQLRQAATIRERMEELQQELAHIIGGSDGSEESPIRRRWKMSPASRARIAAGAKARWAKIKGIATKAPARRSRRKMSSKAKAKLAAIARKRWQKAKAQGKTTL